jgi:putative membrane protein insertion efficiency factor
MKVREGIAAAIGLLLRGLIGLYRYSFSYFLGRQCRFLPTCSAYAHEAIRRHGPVRGSALALRRLCRCHPFGGSGFDPVPEMVEVKGRAATKISF